MEEEKKKKEEKKFELVQVPTEHRLAVQNPEGEVFSIEEAIVELLNKVSNIEKNIG